MCNVAEETGTARLAALIVRNATITFQQIDLDCIIGRWQSNRNQALGFMRTDNHSSAGVQMIQISWKTTSYALVGSIARILVILLLWTIAFARVICAAASAATICPLSLSHREITKKRIRTIENKTEQFFYSPRAIFCFIAFFFSLSLFAKRKTQPIVVIRWILGKDLKRLGEDFQLN